MISSTRQFDGRQTNKYKTVIEKKNKENQFNA